MSDKKEDKKEYKSNWEIFTCPIFYAQVFEGNRDNGDVHSETNGVYKVTMGITEQQKNKMISLGVPTEALGYQTFKTITIDGEDHLVYVAKRPVTSKNLKDEDGNRKEMGPPLVFDYNAAVDAWKEAGSTGPVLDHATPWTMEDGLLGNGTIAKVKLDFYRGVNKAKKPTSIVTLLAVGVVDHVPYTQNDGPRF